MHPSGNMQNLRRINHLKKTLAFQNDILVFRQIPKRYRPSATLETPTESQSPLAIEFQREFERIFFDHLSKVITFNTISLELEMAKARNSCPPSDCTPSTTTPPPSDTNKPHGTIPSTLCNSTSPSPTSSTSSKETPTTTRRKRKRCNRKTRVPNKQLKISPITTVDRSFTTTSVTKDAEKTQLLDLTVHNYSKYELSADEIALLNKGLSFSPTPKISLPELRSQMLKYFNEFAKSLRLKYSRAQSRRKRRNTINPPPSTTATIYRRMKFLPPMNPDTVVTRYSGFSQLETYIDNTKQSIVDNLTEIASNSKHNLTTTQKSAIHQLKQVRQDVIIKPADKNLGVVLMNTDDYVTQCLAHLTDKKTYRLITEYPTHHIKKQLLNTLTNYKQLLLLHDRRLYKYLCEPTSRSYIPRFYGIPKIHKEFTTIPPLRPIVSQTQSLLTPSAKFIDHILQPIACSYPDYLHDSSTLSVRLQDTIVPDNSFLVTLDVVNLYPSIPQEKCLQVIYDELHANRHLLIFDPNLVIKLLHLNISNTFFTFGNLTFQQISGTAMGAPFSPTIANIYMSVTLRRFLQRQHPKLLQRYIDDIFLIWTDPVDSLHTFLKELNSFHPNLRFTHHSAHDSINFLDLSIYKGHHFNLTNILDTKTFQKRLNLYQYLHYTSNHPEKVFKAVIKGECIRYVRTNTTHKTYAAILVDFQKRLLKRNYPRKLIEKVFASVQYNNRIKYLSKKIPKPHSRPPPLYKLIPPPQLKSLKEIVLRVYDNLKTQSPRFVTLKHPTLYDQLVRTAITLTDNQLIETVLSLNEAPKQPLQPAALPLLRRSKVGITKCRSPRCVTCALHLNVAMSFKSAYPLNNTVFYIRHSFTCESTNIVYVITCAKCKKQYVGCTTHSLRYRINHHRSCILRKMPSYIHKHFNLQDHNITHLKVQPIDTAEDSTELRNLEKYWITSLATLVPFGLNVSY